MGRGNVCVHEQYEGLYFIDNDDIDWYYNEDEDEMRLMGNLNYEELTNGAWKYDEEASRIEFEDLMEVFTDSFMRRFPSFERAGENQWLNWRREQRVLMENGLFYVVAEDNEWSVAIELIQKEDPFGNLYYGLQKKHYQRYLDGIRDSLLEWLPQVGTYFGPWCSGSIRKEAEGLISHTPFGDELLAA